MGSPRGGCATAEVLSGWAGRSPVVRVRCGDLLLAALKLKRGTRRHMQSANPSVSTSACCHERFWRKPLRRTGSNWSRSIVLGSARISSQGGPSQPKHRVSISPFWFKAPSRLVQRRPSSLSRSQQRSFATTSNRICTSRHRSRGSYSTLSSAKGTPSGP